MTLRAVSFKEVPAQKVKTMAQQAYNELKEFDNRNEIIQAPDAIAKLKGHLNYERYVSWHERRVEYISQMPSDQFGAAYETAKRFLMLDPFNWLGKPSESFPFELIINLVFEGRRDIRGLELGSSYGAHLFALKERGYTNFMGIDIEPDVVQYANNIGLNVQVGDVTSLLPKESSFDIVLSKHNLDSTYICGEAANKVKKEIDRVLIPGGYFVSFNEDIFERELGPFSSELNFDLLRVFQKVA